MMWPFSEIRRLESELADANRRIEHLKENPPSNNDQDELEFLRTAIKDYVVVRKEGFSCGWSYVYRFFASRTLKDAESDIAKLKLYIAVLEGEIGTEKTTSAKTKCLALRNLVEKTASPEGRSEA